MDKKKALEQSIKKSIKGEEDPVVIVVDGASVRIYWDVLDSEWTVSHPGGEENVSSWEDLSSLLDQLL